jgi:hypothetical protein
MMQRRTLEVRMVGRRRIHLMMELEVQKRHRRSGGDHGGGQRRPVALKAFHLDAEGDFGGEFRDQGGR